MRRSLDVVEDLVRCRTDGQKVSRAGGMNLTGLVDSRSELCNATVRPRPTGELIMKSNRLSVLVSVLTALVLVHQAWAQAPEKKFATPGGKRPTGLFAPGVMVGKTLYIAGKGDYKPKEDTAGKVKNCLGEVRKVLQVAGMDMKNVVQTYVYLEDHDQYAEMNKHYAEFFPADPPTRTTLGVAQVPGDSRLEITCVAYGDLSERKSVGQPPAGMPFSPGVLAGDTLYVSGQVDRLTDGSHPATFEEQVRQAMRNVESVLKQAGLDFRHVVMSNVFLDRRDNLEVADKVYREFFQDGSQPACATSIVDWIAGGSHVEITCVATTDLASRKVVQRTGLKVGPQQGGVTGSPAVWAGNTLYLSAFPGSSPSGENGSADVGNQVRGMAKSHTQVLDEAGLKLEDIVVGFVYLGDMQDYQPMNTVYREFYSRGPGTRTCLMPGSISDKSGPRVWGSFIAARTQ
jgi:2-iminobutanoate/2-iminopropanoate deaminase